MYYLQSKKGKIIQKTFYIFILLVVVERLARLEASKYYLQSNSQIIYGQLSCPYPVAMVFGVALVFGMVKIFRRQVGNYGGTLLFIGAWLNLYDWWKTGGILDYLQYYRLIFNLADVYIIIGLMLIAGNIILPCRKVVNQSFYEK